MDGSLNMMESAEIMLWSLVLMRMSGFVLFNPIIGRRNIPMYIKAGFIMVLSFAIFSFSKDSVNLEGVTNSIEYSLMLLKEFAAGYVLGFIMELFLTIVVYAGGIIDFQIGLSMATVFDAQSNSSLPIMGSLYNMFFLLLFFSVDGHLGLMQVLITSNEVVPYGQFTIGPNITKAILDIFYQCMVMAVKFSFPLLAIEFLAEIAVGVLMKAIPNINVFMVNIQVKLMVGLLVLLILFSPMADFIGDIITQMLHSLQDVLQIM